MNLTQSKKILIPKEMMNKKIGKVVDSGFLNTKYTYDNIYDTYFTLQLEYPTKTAFVSVNHSPSSDEGYKAFNDIIEFLHREANSVNNQIQ